MSDWWSADPVASGGDAAPVRLTVTPQRGLDPRARDLAIRTIYGEAANEPDDGQAAVAAVIRNRIQAGRYGGDNVESVVRARNQFEPWNTTQGQARMTSLRPDDPRYERIGAIVDRVFSGEAPDPTNGATHFFSPTAQAALGRNVPAWAQGEGQPIGRHTFYAPEGRVGAPTAPQGGSEQWWASDPVANQRPQAPATPTDMGGYVPAQVPQSGGDIGRGTAFGRGVAQGASANWLDELKGAQAAGKGAPNIAGIPVDALLGLARIGYESLAGRGQATEAYEGARDAVRSDLTQAQAQYPGTTIAGNVAGAIGMPVGGLLGGATLPARIGRSAAVGAGYGGIAGAGEGTTLDERVRGGATGAAVGGAVGAAAVPALGLVEAAGRGIASAARPVTSAVRGAFNPEGEAARRVTNALTRDMRTGDVALSPAEFAAARNAGAPVSIADLGGETTRAVARSAANTSTEGRAAIQGLADARFEGQADRATQFIRGLVGGADTQGARDALRTAAANVNRPAYARAFNDPNGQSLWDEGFAQIMNAPVVQEAARAATRTGANRAALDGFPPVRNPFNFTGDQVALAGEARPSLQFWDAVKRNLDDRIGALQRAGENSAARDAIQLRAALVNHLDELVPSYRDARAGAARFFGAEDALSAGENFVRSNMTAAEGARALARMSPAERELFRQGFAARLIDDISNTRDRVNVVNKIGQSPQAREKLQLALGPDGFRRVEAFLTVEQAMDRLRAAVQGNSTTARQLMELGLAGGTYGYGHYTGDPGAAANAAVVYGLLRGQRAIDQRVARRVAEMLTSNDPNVLARGVRTAANNQSILRAFRSLDERLARAGGGQSGAVPALQAPGIARPEEDQPSVPRPPGQ